MAVKITHVSSNGNRTQSEQTRILFDFGRAAFASPRTVCTDLSRRLRDGLSLVFHVASALPIDNVAGVIISPQGNSSKSNCLNQPVFQSSEVFLDARSNPASSNPPSRLVRDDWEPVDGIYTVREDAPAWIAFEELG